MSKSLFYFIVIICSYHLDLISFPNQPVLDSKSILYSRCMSLIRWIPSRCGVDEFIAAGEKEAGKSL